VKKAGDRVLSVTAIVLANLCVSYIMTSRVLTFQSTNKNIMFFLQVEKWVVVSLNFFNKKFLKIIKKEFLNT
jgi:hypothetical protein